MTTKRKRVYWLVESDHTHGPFWLTGTGEWSSQIGHAARFGTSAQAGEVLRAVNVPLGPRFPGIYHTKEYLL